MVCGQNCTFLVQANGTVLAVGEGSYGRLGQGNSDDLYAPTIISALQGNTNQSNPLGNTYGRWMLFTDIDGFEEKWENMTG